MSAILIFLATFAVVLCLGLQSLNVNGGHKLLAVITSFGIGTANLYVLKMIPATTSGWEMGAYLIGGPIGILASMMVHPWVLRNFGGK